MDVILFGVMYLLFAGYAVDRFFASKIYWCIERELGEGFTFMAAVVIIVLTTLITFNLVLYWLD